MHLRTRKSVTEPFARGSRASLGLLPAFVVADVDQTSQLAIEAIQRGCAAHKGGGVPDLPVQRDRPRELGAAEAQAVGAGRIGREPFRIDIEHEEDGAAVEIGRQEIMRLPWIDRDHGTFSELVTSIVDIDACGTSPDMEDQMTFAMRVDVEGAVQLIDRRPAKAAVEDGERPAHAFPPR